MGRAFFQLVLGLAFCVARPVWAEIENGPETTVPLPASTSAWSPLPAPVPESESRALGAPERHIAKSPVRTVPAGETRAATSSTVFQGVVGPLAVVLVLIAMLAGLVVLVARLRSRMGGGGSLSLGFGAGGRAPAGILEVLGRFPLARGLTLVLLKVDRRVLLLSQTRQGRFGGLSLTPICELDSPEDVASILLKVRDADSASLTHRFASVFRSLDREAADKVANADKVMTTIAPAQSLPRRAKGVTHKPASASASDSSTEPTGAETAASIRRRLDALRVPALRETRGARS